MSMMGDRSATFGVYDRATSKKFKEKQKKRKKVEERKLLNVEVMQDQFATKSSESLYFSSSASESDYSISEEPICSKMTKPRRRLQKTGALLQVPHDILSKKSVLLLANIIGL